MARKWTGIVLHHSATDDDAMADNWKAIERFHTSWRIGGRIMNPEEVGKYKADLDALQGKPIPESWKWNAVVRPWRAVGYHAGIEKVGGVLRFQMGRTLDEIGAHCQGHNQEMLGFCFVGNFDKDRPEDRMYFNAAAWVGYILSEQPWITLRGIHRHSEFAPKSCPGRFFDMDRFLRYVKVQMGGR